MKKWIFLFLLFWPHFLWAGEVQIQGVSVDPLDEGARVTIEGKASLRGPFRLEFEFDGHGGPQYKITPKNGQLKLEFSTPKRFILGKYKVNLYTENLRKLAEHSFDLGEQEAVLKEKQALRKHMIDLYNTSCEALEQIQRGGLYFIDSLMDFREHHPKEAYQYRKRVFLNWRYYHDFLKELVRQNLQNLEEFKKNIYINPYDSLLKKLSKMLIYGKYLASEYSNWISRWSMWLKENPMLSAQIDRIKKELEETNEEIARALKLKVIPPIKANFLALPFKGETSSNTLKETRLKVELTYDTALWRVSHVPVTPNIRIQLYHRQAPGVIVSLEIFEYPKSRSYEDLRTMTVISAQELWPGFRKLESRGFKVKMIGKEREAFDFIFITERSNQVSRRVSKNRVYQIFCKDKKTIYGLRFFAPERNFGDHLKEFEKLAGGLKVLQE